MSEVPAWTGRGARRRTIGKSAGGWTRRDLLPRQGGREGQRPSRRLRPISSTPTSARRAIPRVGDPAGAERRLHRRRGGTGTPHDDRARPWCHPVTAGGAAIRRRHAVRQPVPRLRGFVGPEEAARRLRASQRPGVAERRGPHDAAHQGARRRRVAGGRQPPPSRVHPPRTAGDALRHHLHLGIDGVRSGGPRAVDS